MTTPQRCCCGLTAWRNQYFTAHSPALFQALIRLGGRDRDEFASTCGPPSWCYGAAADPAFGGADRTATADQPGGGPAGDAGRCSPAVDLVAGIPHPAHQLR